MNTATTDTCNFVYWAAKILYLKLHSHSQTMQITLIKNMHSMKLSVKTYTK